jgi:hypothetical protein
MENFSLLDDGGAEESEERGKIADETDKRLDTKVIELE